MNPETPGGILACIAMFFLSPFVIIEILRETDGKGLDIGDRSKEWVQ